MTNYKIVQYPAFVLTSLALSLNAFGATAVMTYADDDLHSSQPSMASHVGPSDGKDTQSPIQVMLRERTQVLGRVLPEAIENLNDIGRCLVEKIRIETGFERRGELAALVSSVRVISTSSKNTLSFATKPLKTDTDQMMAGIAVSASGALSKSFDQLIGFCLNMKIRAI